MPQNSLPPVSGAANFVTPKAEDVPVVASANMLSTLGRGFIVCLLIWLSIPLAFKFGFGLPFPATLNEFGDSFGGVSALFSALAMAGVIYSLVLQRDDIKLTLAELKSSAEAQKDIANIERENLAAKQSLTEKQDRILEEQAKHRDAMASLFDTQATALREQIALLQKQSAADAASRFSKKFEQRLDRWQEVRAGIGGAQDKGQAYIEANVQVEGKVFSCLNLKEAYPAKLPYDFLGLTYMRYLRSVVLMFNEEFFRNLPKDEREDFSYELRIALSEPERLVLLHLFADATPSANEETRVKAEALRVALARVDALGGVSDDARKCLPGAWNAYSKLVQETKLPPPHNAP